MSAREAVRHTIASYTYAADHGRFDDVAALFAADGVLEVHGTGGARAEGRDAILDFFRGVGSDVVTTAQPLNAQTARSESGAEDPAGSVLVGEGHGRTVTAYR